MPRAPAPGERGAAHGRAERRDTGVRGDRGELCQHGRVAADAGRDGRHRARGARAQELRRRARARAHRRADAPVPGVPRRGRPGRQERHFGKGSFLPGPEPAGAAAYQHESDAGRRAAGVPAGPARAVPARIAGLAARRPGRAGGNAPDRGRAVPGGHPAARAARSLVGGRRADRVAGGRAGGRRPAMARRGEGGVQPPRLPDPRPGGRGGQERRRAPARGAVFDCEARGRHGTRQAGEAALSAREPVSARREAGRRAGARRRAPRSVAVRHAFPPRRAQAGVGAVRRRRARQGACLSRAGRRLQDQDQGSRQPAPDQAARCDHAGRGKAARALSAAGADDGDRDGVGLPAGRACDRPFQQPGGGPRGADRHHGRVAARCRQRQIDGRAAGRLAPRSHRAHRRAAAARPGREGNPRQPAAQRAGDRCVRPRRDEARDAR